MDPFFYFDSGLFCELGSANENADVGMHFVGGDGEYVVGGFVSVANRL